MYCWNQKVTTLVSTIRNYSTASAYTKMSILLLRLNDRTLISTFLLNATILLPSFCLREKVKKRNKKKDQKQHFKTLSVIIDSLPQTVPQLRE